MNMTEECHVCGGDAHLLRDPMEISIGHRSTTVPAERMRCGSCSAEFFLPGQLNAAQQLAAREVRAREGLLEPEEIRAIREMLELTQAQFEKLLGVGAKTVIRWEKGTVFQNAATDALLRLARDVPGAAEYLAARRGINVGAPVADQSQAAPSQPDWLAGFHLQMDPVVFATRDDEMIEEDPKVISLDDYRSKKPLAPIPPDLLRRASL